jgi:hypothetical protein
VVLKIPDPLMIPEKSCAAMGMEKGTEVVQVDGRSNGSLNAG